MSTVKRTFQDMRQIRDITDIGYVACLDKLLEIYDIFSRPLITLLFDDLDKPLANNPCKSLFIGNIPIIELVLPTSVDSNKTDTNIIKNKRSRVSCWDERLVKLLFMNGEKIERNESDDDNLSFEKAFLNKSLIKHEHLASSTEDISSSHLNPNSKFLWKYFYFYVNEL